MAGVSTPAIRVPDHLLPSDGRFGCGPSRVRPEAVAALAERSTHYLGTSHRQPAVQYMVAELRNGLAELFALPDGYEVLLGNGGSTVFWDIATFGLIERRSQHLTFGEFSSKFAKAATDAPHLEGPSVLESAPGSHPLPVPEATVDAYCLTHNETSTGVAMPLVRPDAEGLVLVDATSAAGGLRFDAAETDVYYFAPQKCLASDGGVWFAACSPRAIERIERIASGDRWVPAFLDLGIALENSRKDQTYNTPALATLFLANEQVQWILEHGGLTFSAGRCDRSAENIYGWADAHPAANPFVADHDARSHVVATIDFDDSVDAATLAAVLRSNGIIDVEPYRKLGRNQLRVALFPAIDPDDVAALTACVDHVIEHIT
jgi:phosphoserine aminotransferase